MWAAALVYTTGLPLALGETANFIHRVLPGEVIDSTKMEHWSAFNLTERPSR